MAGTGLFILREINADTISPEVMSHLRLPDIVMQTNITKKNQMPPQIYEFEDGTAYVRDEMPRDQMVTEEILGNTLGWGVFDEEWTLRGTFRSRDRAEQAVANATVKSRLFVELEEDEEDGDGAGAADPGSGVVEDPGSGDGAVSGTSFIDTYVDSNPGVQNQVRRGRPASKAGGVRRARTPAPTR